MTIINWKKLETLRGIFLDATSGVTESYWSDPEVLALYDRFFAERIGWKWNAVLSEIRARFSDTWESKLPTTIIDWGCGTGIATRRYLQTFFTAQSSVNLWFIDRDRAATTFAKSRVTEQFANAQTHTAHKIRPDDIKAPYTLLISHVCNELKPAAETDLLQLIEAAQQTIWVEPGTHLHSRKMIAMRESLLASGKITILAPCPHQKTCGMLAPENRKDWCHHFASPPNAVFQNAEWAEFAKRMSIDLRALPYSFLVTLDRSIALNSTHTSAEERIIGRPRFYKGYLKYLGCDENGVRETSISKRKQSEIHAQISEGMVHLTKPPV